MSASAASPITLINRSFGFNPIDSQHHFRVYIPRGSTQPIVMSEHLTWTEGAGSSPVTTGREMDGQVRVTLLRLKWDLIADAVRAEFNRRLKLQGLATGIWRPEANVVRRDFGKELVLLAWAIEEAEPAVISSAIVNWLGLYPEERWWLYTQTAAASGHGINGRNIGWRKAVRYALTENPISDTQRDALVVPEYFRRAEARAQPTLLESSAEHSSEEN